MEYIRFGSTGMKVSRLCLGCMSYGQPAGEGWQWALDEEASRPFIKQALDSYTELIQMGSRFYDPTLARWIQPDTIVPGPGDPQALNRYAYVRNSPLKYIDPTGHVYLCDAACEENEGKPFFVKGFDIGKLAKYERQYHPEDWDNRRDWLFGAKPRDAEKGREEAVGLGVEWLSGTGPRHREFGPGDAFTTELKNYEGVTHDALPRIRKSLEAGDYAKPDDMLRNVDDSLSGIQGVPKFIKNYSASMTLGATGNIAAAYLGSYAGTYNVLQVDETEGGAVVRIDVTNSSSAVSGFRPPVIGYTPFWNNVVGPIENGMTALLPGSMMNTTTQHIWWFEVVEFSH